MTMATVQVRQPACETYRFYFTPVGLPLDEGDVVVAATGGPGLGWRFALNDALRQRARQREQIGWRSVRYTELTELPLRNDDGLRWIGRLKIRTTRDETLDVGVLHGPRSRR